MRNDGVAAVILVALAVGGCRNALAPPQAVAVRIPNDGFMASLAQDLRGRAPNLDVRIVDTNGSGGAAAALREQKLDLALMPASEAYFAYLDGARQNVSGIQLRAISALHTTPLLAAVRAGSGIHRIGELEGHPTARIIRASTSPDAPTAMTPEQQRQRGLERPDSNRLVELVLTAFSAEPTRTPRLQVLLPEDALARLGAGSLDAIFGTAYYTGDVIRAAAERGAHLIPIEGSPIDHLRQQYAFIRPVVIAPQSYPGQTEAIHSIGVDMLLVCRADLEESLVYELTKQYVASLPDLSRANPSLALIDLELASASPIPLHDGAARFYRESELFR